MKRHDFEPGILIAGLVFLAVTVVYLLDAAGAWNVPSRWAVAIVGVSIGVAAGAGGWAAQRRTRGPERGGW